MSDSNRTRLSYALEATYGTHPGGTLTDLRITGESLKHDTNTVSSQELRSDRNIPDNLRVGISASGGINFELSCISPGAQDGFNLDNWWVYALGSAGYSSTIAAISTTATWTSAGAGSYSGTLIRAPSSDWAAIPVGRWIRVVAGNAANVGWWKVTAKSTTVNPGDTMTLVGFKDITAAAGDTVTVRTHRMILNGTTQYSMTIVKQFADLSGAEGFELFRGSMIDKMAIDVKNDAVISGSVELLGSLGESASASGGSGSYAASPSSIVLTGVAGVVGIMENNKPIAATGFSISIQNNLRSRQVIGTLGAISVGQGSIVVTGSLTMYFNNTGFVDASAIIDKYLNATPTSLSLAVAEQPTSAFGGNYQIWDLQNVKYTSGQALSPAINTDVMIELQWQAIIETTEPEGAYTIRYTRG